MAEEKLDLLAQAESVLKQNDRGLWTVPAGDLYPHQWLWDSCFIAIGLRHINLERAQTELRSLLRGQWSNGMLPNMIFAPGKQYQRDRDLWRSYVSPFAPADVATSGITQPPMLAEAVTRLGQKMKIVERRSWYASMYPALLHYHKWLYDQRDPRHEGLIVLVHPYESGMDLSPPWIDQLYQFGMPWWVRLIGKLHLDKVADVFRRDTKYVPANQRAGDLESISYWSAIHGLRNKAYNSEAILTRPQFAVEDVAFNSILIRANHLLQDIAKTIGKELPETLFTQMSKTESALDGLWDESSGYYYSRSFISNKLIEEPSIASLIPLYSGSISKERAELLVKHLLNDQRRFATRYPIPSVPVKSNYFDPIKYWQGPSWVNMNWLIADGLSRYGFEAEARQLRESTLAMVGKSCLAEYFNPLTGEPAGDLNFSWTAALTIDLLKT